MKRKPPQKTIVQENNEAFKRKVRELIRRELKGYPKLQALLLTKIYEL